MSYEGWRNYQTWNVMLWLTNDEPLYEAMVNYLKEQPRATYLLLIDALQNEHILGPVTPDGVSWTDPTLDEEALNESLDDFRPGGTRIAR